LPPFLFTLAPERKPVILLEDCVVVRGHKEVLKSVSWQVGAGDLVVINGAAGSGKSTLIKLLAGIVSANSGRVEVLGKVPGATSDTERTKFRRELGLLLPELDLMDDANCLENAVLPLRIAGASSADWHARGMKTLLDFELGHLALQRPEALSPGEQARLRLARALIHRPALVLADEPFAQTDAGSLQVMKARLALAAAEGTTVVLAGAELRDEIAGARHFRLSEGRLL